MAQQITELPALWQEAEQHIRAFEQLARRTVEAAWLAGDALLRIKEQLPHGAWTPALKERGIPVRTAQRFIRLRQTYPQKRQLVVFDSVTAALAPRRTEPKQRGGPVFLVSVDDLWDWERGEVTALARRFLSAEELEEFNTAILDTVREYYEECRTDQELAEALTWFRLALSSQVDFGPLENDPDAVAETERRTSAFYGNEVDWIDNPGDFLRITLNSSKKLGRPTQD